MIRASFLTATPPRAAASTPVKRSAATTSGSRLLRADASGTPARTKPAGRAPSAEAVRPRVESVLDDGAAGRSATAVCSPAAPVPERDTTAWAALSVLGALPAARSPE